MSSIVTGCRARGRHTALAALLLGALPVAGLLAATLQVHNGGDPTSLDPHRLGGDWENRIAGDIFEGLITEDAHADVIPGQAQSWQISDDGLTYTFTLREDIRWTDGTPVTAGDFEFAFKRLMDPATAADYAYLQYPIRNAEAINAGDVEPNELGVQALDERRLEITLERPTPYFLGALKHYTAYPLPQHVVEEHGTAWMKIDNIVTNGPYKPIDWVPGSQVTTLRNELYYDTDNIDIDGVIFHVLEDESAALKRYRAGEFHILTDFPADQYAWMQKHMPGEARVAPFAGLYYYVVNHNNAPFDDARVRKALSMAVNREVIGPDILGTGELPAYSWVPPDMANYGEPVRAEWADTPYGQRVEEAKKLLEEAGFSATSPLSLQLRYNTNENHKRVAVAIAAMWKPLGVKVDLYNTEVKVHYDELSKNVLDIARAGWLADYNDATSFLSLLISDIGYNYGRYNNPKYDALLDKASTMLDLEARSKVLKQAEAIALADSAAIPIYYYASRNVVSPKVVGFVDNVFDIHRTRWLRLKK